MTEDAFLQTLRDRPDDDVTRRVFADWLDEQDDPTCQVKAEYIRTDLELAAITRKLKRGSRWLPTPAQRRAADRRRLAEERRRELAQNLDIEWMAVVSLSRIEACTFEFMCPLKWESLDPVEGETAVRHCGKCQEEVYYCGTLEEAKSHAWQGHSVAVDPRVPRKAGDLDRRNFFTMGRIMAPPRCREDD